MKPLRVLSIFGTRPEAVKMAPVIKRLEITPGVESLVCVTAQHREMLDQVLNLFKICPDMDLNLMRPNQTLAQVTTADEFSSGDVGMISGTFDDPGGDVSFDNFKVTAP